MTSASLALGGRRLAMPAVLARIVAAEPAYSTATVLFLAMIPATLLAGLIDARLLDGVSVWSKPLKFETSLALYFATLALFSAAIAPPARGLRRLLAVTAVIAVACALGEMAYIILQAARGVRSHFNTGTALEAALFRAMGIGAITLTLAAPILGIAVLRRPAAGLPPLLVRAIGLGLILTFLLGAGGGILIGGNGSHWVGGVPTDTGGLPLFGWSRTGGDLRVAHFIGIHAMQILPALALLAYALGARRTVVADILAVLVIAATVATAAQALAGQPFLSFLG